MRPTRSLSILVTGAGSGIGWALAQHFAKGGHRVIAADINAKAVAERAAELAEPGVTARGLVLDVASGAGIEAALPELNRDPPDVLINNAGLQYVAPLEQFPPEQWERLIAVMLTGAALLTRAVLPGMRARRFGRIVNVGSVHSLVASPYKSAYVAAKHGLIGFSKVIALETGDCDVTINTVCPSYVMTPLVESQIDSLARTHGLPRERVMKEIMLDPMPKRQFIGMDELAGAIGFLLSDVARNITGQCITIDGGWTAQ
jgi:3-hydroxybutyrate dehydrogenase